MNLSKFVLEMFNEHVYISIHSVENKISLGDDNSSSEEFRKICRPSKSSEIPKSVKAVRNSYTYNAICKIYFSFGSIKLGDNCVNLVPIRTGTFCRGSSKTLVNTME